MLVRNKYFFVVGVGRSGTSLAMSMLDAHPAIAVPPETQLLTRFLKEIPTADLDQLISLFTGDEKFRRIGLDSPTLREIAADLPGRHPFHSIYQGFLDWWAHKHDVRIVGDKAPKYIEVLPVIKELFPQAVIFHVIRDPRDVFLSRTKAKWSAGRPAWMQLLAYRSQYAMGRQQGRDLFGQNYCEIHYEALVKEPDVTLRRMCEALGLDFDPAMLDFSANAGNLVFSDEMSWKKELFGPLLKTNFEKWRQELTDQEIGRIEISCPQPFSDGSYQTAGRAPVWSRVFWPPVMAILDRVYRGRVTGKNQKLISRLDDRGKG